MKFEEMTKKEVREIIKIEDIPKHRRTIKSCIVDVETTVLQGILQEEIYMKIPEVMYADSYNCLLPAQTIYGLLQSSREFYK
jgi:hypothetical protein